MWRVSFVDILQRSLKYRFSMSFVFSRFFRWSKKIKGFDGNFWAWWDSSSSGREDRAPKLIGTHRGAQSEYQKGHHHGLSKPVAMDYPTTSRNNHIWPYVRRWGGSLLITWFSQVKSWMLGSPSKFSELSQLVLTCPNSHFVFLLILGLFKISCMEYNIRAFSSNGLVSIQVFLYVISLTIILCYLYVISLTIILGHKPSHNFLIHC